MIKNGKIRKILKSTKIKKIGTKMENNKKTGTKIAKITKIRKI